MQKVTRTPAIDFKIRLYKRSHFPEHREGLGAPFGGAKQIALYPPIVRTYQLGVDPRGTHFFSNQTRRRTARFGR